MILNSKAAAAHAHNLHMKKKREKNALYIFIYMYFFLESQTQSFAVMLFAPLVGYLVDMHGFIVVGLCGTVVCLVALSVFNTTSTSDGDEKKKKT